MSKIEIYFFLRDTYFWFLRLLFFWLPVKVNHKKLLIIRSDHVGDFIIFSPAIKYIKEIYRDHQIYFLGNKILTEITNWFPEIDQFISLDVKNFQFNPVYYFWTFYRLRREFFDVVLCPVYSRSFMTDELVRIANAREKIGFGGDNSNIGELRRLKDNTFFTRLINPANRHISEVEINKTFLKYLGAKKVDSLIPVVKVKANWLHSAQKVLINNGWDGKKYVVINLGASMKCKVWPVKKYARVIQFLLKREFSIIFTGIESENYLFEDTSRIIDTTNAKLINVIGKTSFSDLVGILSGATLYFGSDTGTLHLAAATGCPAICLMGGGHFGRFFPYGDLNKNRVVYSRNMKCKNDNWACIKLNINKAAPCIENIQLKDAIEKIKEMII